MVRPPLSVTLITLNEAHQIAAAIGSVRGWAEDILVIDAGSTDGTVAVAEAAGARVLEHPWPGFGQQKNFAQARAHHDWVLNLDADEQASPELKRDIDRVLDVARMGEPPWAYEFPRRNHYLGRWIRHGGWFPDRVRRLAHRGHAHWTEPDVHEELTAAGQIGRLEGPLLHYGFHSIHDQVETNSRYSRLGARALARAGARGSLARLILKPCGKFVETYLVKRGFLDGLPGFIIAVNAAYSMFMKQAYLLESGLRAGPNPNAHPDHRQ